MHPAPDPQIFKVLFDNSAFIWFYHSCQSLHGCIQHRSLKIFLGTFKEIKIHMNSDGNFSMIDIATRSDTIVTLAITGRLGSSPTSIV